MDPAMLVLQAKDKKAGQKASQDEPECFPPRRE